MYSDMTKLYRDRDWLNMMYVVKKLSIIQMGKIAEVDYKTIWNWLHRFNILISRGEKIHLAKANHCQLSQEAREWIDGELLGDGCLQSQSLHSARFQHSSKYLEYIQYVSNILNSFGIEQAGQTRKQYYKNWDCYNYHYKSRSYAELLPIRKRWYPKGKKIVPKDLELTPLVCRQWYIGDGGLICKKEERPYIGLATCGFLINDVEWLVSQLNELGFKATRWNSNNTICISVHSTKAFLDYIDKCPVRCYQYKWNY